TRSFTKARFIYSEFKNFRDQRIRAAGYCSNDIILFLDSDEIPDSDFEASVNRLKREGFEYDVYTITRSWIVLGRAVHAVYPVTSPDDPIRIYNRTKASFESSPELHEAPRGYRSVGRIGGTVKHITFETIGEIERKTRFYSDIAANDLIKQQKNIGLLTALFMPPALFFKWYILKKGYKDGWTGLRLAHFAYNISKQKYAKARKMVKTI
ncbi:MAG: hypothetical protein AB7C90_08405, partial [Bacteroidales bacterium]